MLKTHITFYQDLQDINDKMRRLVSDMVHFKDEIKIDLLKITIIDIMKAIVKASDYIRTFLAKRKIGEE